jgi:hypothetical protein
MGAAAAAVVAGAAASVVAVMPGLLAAEDVVVSVVVAGASAAAGAVAAGSMPSGSVISRPPAADPGEGAACAKSDDLTARPSRLRAKTSKAHREQMFSALPPEADIALMSTRPGRHPASREGDPLICRERTSRVDLAFANQIMGRQ